MSTFPNYSLTTRVEGTCRTVSDSGPAARLTPLWQSRLTSGQVADRQRLRRAGQCAGVAGRPYLKSGLHLSRSRAAWRRPPQFPRGSPARNSRVQVRSNLDRRAARRFHAGTNVIWQTQK